MTCIYDLQLPGEPVNGDVRVLQALDGEVVWREPSSADMEWDTFAGDGRYNPIAGSAQPFVGCPTRGDMVAAYLMDLLAT